MGGWTNTGDAIRHCYETLKFSNNKRAIIIVTDGTPTAGNDLVNITGKLEDNQEHQEYAVAQSDLVKGAHIEVIPVAIKGSVSFNEKWLKALASSQNMYLSV